MGNKWQTEGGDPRVSGPTRGERDNVLAYLRYYRTTLELKCDGLDAGQLARRSVPPSTLSLLGLLRHLAYVEHFWSRVVLQGHRDEPQLYQDPDDRDADFNGARADDGVVAEAWGTWRAAVAEAEVWQEQDTDWDRLITDPHGGEFEVRDVMVHLVEEYARHVGHADLLRESIDGRTGE